MATFNEEFRWICEQPFPHAPATVIQILDTEDDLNKLDSLQLTSIVPQLTQCIGVTAAHNYWVMFLGEIVAMYLAHHPL